MKKLSMFTTILVFLFSCQQDNPPNPTPTCNEPAATFKYKLDGTLLEMNGSLSQNSVEGSYIRRVKDFFNGQPTQCGPYYTPNCTNYMYTLEATKWSLLDDEGNPIFKIWIRSSSLNQGQIVTGSSNIQAIAYYPSQLGTNLVNSNFSLTITKIVNGYADGIFSGTLKNSSGTISYQLTEGEFKNVKILQ